MALIINRNTRVPSTESEAVNRAAGALKRDMERVFSKTSLQGADICFVRESTDMESEQYVLSAGEKALEIHAVDDLGFIYGIFEISRRYLQVPDFWFWMDWQPVQRESVCLPEGENYRSKPCAVRYRGWFLNDEVLLHTWSVDRQKEKPWEMAFEALLRCRGNMVIPGTDRNSEHYRALASAMGLSITHHHAEPLGAEMFARAYPNLTPSYAEHPEKFRALWRDAVKAQEGMSVIWNLGFRGQGDCPFWENDSRYATDEARGELLGGLIRMQYDLVKESDRDAVCCTNLYGEIMELFQKGCLNLPEDIIKIWADNGYGKMVSRRQGNHNPRIPALPDGENKDRGGIYYHVSFYDLQAANHITMLPNSPGFVIKELGEVLKRNVDDFWIINCSNIKPHIYFLDLTAQMWREGSVDVRKHRRRYAECYYGAENAPLVEACLEKYAQYAPEYGKHEDEHAGEQFVNHVPRMLISQFMRDRHSRSEDMLWASDAGTLEKQVEWYAKICSASSSGYAEYLNKCETALTGMTGDGRHLFEDTCLLQVKILCHCHRGALLVSESILQAFDERYQKAFYLAGKAREEYLAADAAMRACEHGKWHNFYANECLTDIKQTAWVTENMMGFLRNLGDGPHFFEWQREFLLPEEDRRVRLLLNMENHLRDLELFELMKERWDL